MRVLLTDEEKRERHEEFLMIITHLYSCQKHVKLDHPLPEMQYLILDDLVQLYLKEV